MNYFEDEQLEFLIDLIYDIQYCFRNFSHIIPISEIIVEHINISDGQKVLLERLKGELRKRVENNDYKIKELIERGKEICKSELRSKLFISFLLTDAEKQQLFEEIIAVYLKGCPEYKRKDFDKLPSNEDLLDLIDYSIKVI